MKHVNSSKFIDNKKELAHFTDIKNNCKNENNMIIPIEVNNLVYVSVLLMYHNHLSEDNIIMYYTFLIKYIVKFYHVSTFD